MLNIYEQVDRNKRKSAVIIAAFIIFIVAFVWILGQFLGSDPSLIIFAAIFSLLSSVGSYFWGDKIVLAISNAKPANREDHFNFYTAAENLAIAAQIPTPKLYVINSPAMNAFATGRDPKNATICATTGLIRNLDKSELEGVIAHEISHIINYDILVMTITAVLVGMVTLISNWIMRSTRLFSSGNRRSRRGTNPIALIAGIITLIVSPIIAKLIQLAISRRREYLADASAVKLTKQPQGLINALKKLASNPIPLKMANSATAHLYITNPFKKMKIAAFFSTHPPIQERIANLEKML